MAVPFTAILFDLDGTIVDSAPGITAALAWTFEKLGRPVPTPAELLAYVGPPILESFQERAGMSEAEAEHALSIYRPRYLETGAFDSSLYPGITEVIKAIGDSELPLSLATSKPESLAKVMLEYYGIDQHFDFFTGASDDEVRSAKADVVEEALARLTAFGADMSRPVLVGDRHHDVDGAAEHGVPTIFARWGYGSRAEEAGTIAAVDSPSELRRLLLP